MVACLACWCRGKPFPSPCKYGLTTLMTFKIPDITIKPPDILLTCTWVCRGLDGSTCSESSPRGVRLSTARARATDLGQGPNLRTGSGRAPCVPRSREHEKRPAAGRDKNAKGPKEQYTYMHMSGGGCLCLSWTEI